MIATVVIACLYGLLFGSFANAVAYRVPHKETLMTRSHCPKCNAQIAAYDNIPVISWIILRGKCRNCKNSISFQYPAIELSTSIIFGVLAYYVTLLNLHFVSSLLMIIGLCYFAFIGVVLSIIDMKEMRLPTVLIYPTIAVVGLCLAVAAIIEQDYSKLLVMLLGAVVSGGFYLIVCFIFPNGMGLGDARLSLLTGMILGWFSFGHVVLGLILPFLILSIVCLPLMITKVLKRKTKLPLGPWILVGCVVTILVGSYLIDAYLSLLFVL